jgi:hypothetical protein
LDAHDIVYNYSPNTFIFSNAVVPLDKHHSHPELATQEMVKGKGARGEYVGREADGEQPKYGAIMVGFDVLKSRLTMPRR